MATRKLVDRQGHTPDAKVDAVIRAARDVAECREDVTEDGPCGACLEILDEALAALDGRENRKAG